MDATSDNTTTFNILHMKRPLVPIEDYAKREGISIAMVEDCALLGIVQIRKARGKTYVVDVPLGPLAPTEKSPKPADPQAAKKPTSDIRSVPKQNGAGQSKPNKSAAKSTTQNVQPIRPAAKQPKPAEKQPKPKATASIQQQPVTIQPTIPSFENTLQENIHKLDLKEDPNEIDKILKLLDEVPAELETPAKSKKKPKQPGPKPVPNPVVKKSTPKAKTAVPKPAEAKPAAATEKKKMQEEDLINIEDFLDDKLDLKKPQPKPIDPDSGKRTGWLFLSGIVMLGLIAVSTWLWLERTVYMDQIKESQSSTAQFLNQYKMTNERLDTLQKQFTKAQQQVMDLNARLEQAKKQLEQTQANLPANAQNNAETKQIKEKIKNLTEELEMFTDIHSAP